MKNCFKIALPCGKTKAPCRTRFRGHAIKRVLRREHAPRLSGSRCSAWSRSRREAKPKREHKGEAYQQEARDAPAQAAPRRATGTLASCHGAFAGRLAGSPLPRRRSEPFRGRYGQRPGSGWTLPRTRRHRRAGDGLAEFIARRQCWGIVQLPVQHAKHDRDRQQAQAIRRPPGAARRLQFAVEQPKRHQWVNVDQCHAEPAGGEPVAREHQERQRQRPAPVAAQGSDASASGSASRST